MPANGYPKVTTKAWRELRNRATAAPSTKFTPGAVAALMGMSSPESARDNTVTPMRRLGLIDDDGSLTDRGNKWRVDGTYAAACQEILDEVYPAELSSLADDDGPDADQVRTWFDHKGFGSSNARQMAATYVMIATKELPAAGNSAAPPRKVKAPSKKATATRKGTSRPVKQTPAANDPVVDATPSTAVRPNLHLDIQIHIPADATGDQLDRIFESMARHLYS